ncbi:MAG: MFS transporter [Anaerolineales bacterium]|nr:MFS transporter [Anaerolineales bacterium]
MTNSTSISYRSILQNRNFVFLWLAESISLLGDIVFQFSINWLILAETGSALQIGGNLVVSVIARVFFKSVAGVLADRWNRRWLMVSSDLLRGGLVLCLATLLWLMPFNILYIYIGNFLLTSISSFFMPAFQATIPNVLDKNALVAGRSLTMGTARLLQTLGSAASGLLIAMFGVHWGILINALSFFLSALAIFMIRISRAVPSTHHPLNTSALFGDAFKGWQFIRSQTILASIFLLFTLTDFGAAFTWPVHVVFTEKILNGGPQLYGYLATAATLGGLIGAFFIGRYSHWFNRHIGWSYLIAASAWGFLSILFGITSSPLLALGYRFLLGWALSMIHVPISSLLDASVTDEYRGRVWATIGIGSSLVTPISVGLSGLAADHWSPRASYIIAGTLLITNALLVFQLPGIRNARIDRK